MKIYCFPERAEVCEEDFHSCPLPLPLPSLDTPKQSSSRENLFILFPHSIRKGKIKGSGSRRERARGLRSRGGEVGRLRYMIVNQLKIVSIVQMSAL
mmetsp:Transcript_29933/g.58740  ORF Transcript_29933/g.58740 Transcript_29933/m.58740 type:complete len:97 (-) Transcript_29933:170-460(-)